MSAVESTSTTVREVLFSAKTALSGQITDNVLAVAVSWRWREGTIRFIYFREPNVEEIETASSAAGVFIGDLPRLRIVDEPYTVSPDWPPSLGAAEWWAFLRADPGGAGLALGNEIPDGVDASGIVLERAGAVKMEPGEDRVDWSHKLEVITMVFQSLVGRVTPALRRVFMLYDGRHVRIRLIFEEGGGGDSQHVVSGMGRFLAPRLPVGVTSNFLVEYDSKRFWPPIPGEEWIFWRSEDYETLEH